MSRNWIYSVFERVNCFACWENGTIFDFEFYLYSPCRALHPSPNVTMVTYPTHNPLRDEYKSGGYIRTGHSLVIISMSAHAQNTDLKTFKTALITSFAYKSILQRSRTNKFFISVTMFGGWWTNDDVIAVNQSKYINSNYTFYCKDCCR